jgi:hypothetical protein
MPTTGPFDGPNARELVELLPATSLAKRLVEEVVVSANQSDARSAIDSMLEAELKAEYEKLNDQDQAD